MPLTEALSLQERRREIWKHNSFSGHACMMMQQAQAILNSRTATDETKKVAYEIQARAELLCALLKERKELP